MTVLPQPRGPIDPDRPWKPRTYPASPAAIGRVRADLRADLALMVGAGEELVAAVVLCASEMFANTVDRALDGGGPEEVVCVLSLHRLAEGGRVLRLSMAGQGAADTAARVPYPVPGGGRHGGVRGRELLLIDHLAARWGTRRAASPGGGGGVVWAEFDLAPCSLPRLARGRAGTAQTTDRGPFHR